MNSLILTFHTSVVALLALLFFRIGKEFLIAYLALLSILMNLFVLKQMTIFGLTITCSDALAVGYLLGLNLIQEFFGRSAARKMIWIGFLTAISFLLLSQIHLIYSPSIHDTMHLHYQSLLSPQLRIIFASLTSFLLIQFLDIRVFARLRDKFKKKWFPLRVAISLVLAETIDTFLFSFLGLYGLVASIGDIILFSLIAKLFVIALSIPFTVFARRIHVSV
ncbi:MAG: queuosine precursor transporter [Chlamydiales bacterium]|nr:queuosine precursor transporter [Chlamydiales bacterium]MCH9620264.1 queuosine precursor transporter [Chlamydiales bacterium]MCH9622826.1 queuosine precursor transporter [Chlamydiales bacterium]